MVSLKLWYKKIKYVKKKKIILIIFFVSIPLIVFNSIIMTTLNTYFEAFEEFTYQNYISDLSIKLQNHDFKEMYEKIEDSLEGYPLKGITSQFSKGMTMNASFYDIDSNLTLFLQNYSLYFINWHFSSNVIKKHYLEELIEIELGQFPRGNNELLLPIAFKTSHDISINSTIKFQLNPHSNINVSVSGFYSGVELYRFSPNSAFIFGMENISSNLLFQALLNISSYTDYFIYLDHKFMDIFNTNNYILRLENAEYKLRRGLLHYLSSPEDVSSSASLYRQSAEFSEFINQVASDILLIIIPILMVIFFYNLFLGNLILSEEKPYWDRIKLYLSLRNFKLQVFVEIFLNSIFSYLFANFIGLILFFLLLSTFLGSFAFTDIYLPESYWILTFTFFFFYIIILYLTILKLYSKNQISTLRKKRWDHWKKGKRVPKKILISLIIIVFFPAIDKLVYIIAIYYNNPLLTSIKYLLNSSSDFIKSFYSTIFLITFLSIFSLTLIKLSQYIINKRFISKKLGFRKYPGTKNFIHYKSRNIILILLIISVAFGYINYNHFMNINKSSRSEYMIYTEFGSDYKVYEPYYFNKTIELSAFVNESFYCEIKSLPGQVSHPFVLEKYMVFITLSPDKYYSVLNSISLNSFDLTLINAIKSLKNNEILIPSFFKIKYGWKIGDMLKIQPKNTSSSSYYGEYLEDYEKQFEIKGFFNNFPGLDRDDYISGLPFFENGVLMITAPEFNYTEQFKPIPILHSYLIKDFPNCELILESLTHNYSYIYSRSLNTELTRLKTSYQQFSNKYISILYSSFIFSFILVTFFLSYQFLNENSNVWDLFQLFGIKLNSIKRFVRKILLIIFILAFILSFVGSLCGILIFYLDNFRFIADYYIYPIQIHFDPINIIFNLIFLIMIVLNIELILSRFKIYELRFSNLKKYFLE